MLRYIKNTRVNCFSQPITIRRWKKIKKICENEDCRKEYNAGHPKSQRFCGVSCYRDWQIRHKRSNTKICESCGEEFYLKRTGQKFCSQKCGQKRSKKSTKDDVVTFRDLKLSPNETDMEKICKQIEIYQDYARTLSTRQDEISIDIKTDKPINLIFPADIHIGAIGCFLQQFREMINMISKKPRTYVISCGDTVDNFVPTIHGEGQFEVAFPPSVQKAIAEHIFGKLKGQLLAMIQGDHEEFSHATDDFDFTKHLCQRLKCANLGFGGFINLKVGKQKYKIHARHRYRFNSSLNPTHTVKRMLSEEGDFDIGVVAHNHTSDIEFFTKSKVMRVAVRPGSYKRADRYARKIGFSGNIPRIPFVKLWHNERKMAVYPDLSYLDL